MSPDAVGWLTGQDKSVIPSGLRHSRFVLSPLTAHNAALDHACYLASPDVIRIHSDGRWPTQGFSLSDDLVLVARHEDDHRNGRAFTFLLLTPWENEALGCVYLNPLREYLMRAEAPRQVVDRTPVNTAMVTFWLRQDQQDSGLAEIVVGAVNTWLLDEWPLSAHLFRVLPDEWSSVVALDRLGLQRIHLAHPGDERPYL